MKLNFSGHLDMQFGDRSVSQRVETFAKLGFTAVELWAYWDYDLDELERALADNHMTLAAICTRFVSLTDSSQREAYLAGVRETIEACHRLDCHVIISQVGAELPDVPRERQHESIVEGLKETAKLLENEDIILVIEPLNILVDHKGYFLSSSQEAADIVTAVDSPHIKMLFDIYHQQITEGNLISNIRKHYPLIGHVHVADNPGRHQPGTGEINYQNVLAALQEKGYQGFIGTEFKPLGDDWDVCKEFARTMF